MHEGDAQAEVVLPARAGSQRIVESAWPSSEPGIASLDRINVNNPVKSLVAIHSSNPCGEYWQVDYNSRNLGSINLSRYVSGRDGATIPWSQKIEWK